MYPKYILTIQYNLRDLKTFSLLLCFAGGHTIVKFGRRCGQNLFTFWLDIKLASRRMVLNQTLNFLASSPCRGHLEVRDVHSQVRFALKSFFPNSSQLATSPTHITSLRFLHRSLFEISRQERELLPFYRDNFVNPGFDTRAKIEIKTILVKILCVGLGPKMQYKHVKWFQ